MKIFALRHAQSEGNLNWDLHHVEWDFDIKLTPEGITQARAAGKQLAKWQETNDATFKFYVSPFHRTNHTYQLITESLIKPYEFYEEIRLREVEKNYTAYPHEINKELETNDHKRRFYFGSLYGESIATVYDRTCSFITDLRLDTKPKVVPVIISHGAIIRSILRRCGNAPLSDFFLHEISPPNAHIYELDF